MAKTTLLPEIQNAVDHVIGRLRAAGVVVQRYDAASGSAYLKLDYGVANSIRIANHPGKVHLKYRYNLIQGLTEYSEQMDGFQRRYWPIEDMDACVDAILEERKNKMARFGDHYADFMEQNRENHKGERGFWSSARLVE